MAEKKEKAKKPVKVNKPRPKVPAGMLQISSPIRPELSFYVAQEIADDRVIEQELLGAAVGTMVYEFELNGKTLNGLSWPGVREVVRQLNRNPKSGHKIRISPEPPKITRDLEQGGQRGIEVMCYAEDIVSGSGLWGSKFEPYKKADPNMPGSLYDNPFAFETALSKAQRNAMRGLLPEKVVNEMIEKLRVEKGAVEKIVGPDEQIKEVPPMPSSSGVMYGAALKRVNKIKADKHSLQEALDNVDALGLEDDQKKNITKLIKEYLKKLN
jgi:hypothetical protein